MRVVSLLIAAIALTACASPRAAGAGGVASAKDCAVISAVLTQHYKIDAETPYRLDRGDGPKAKDEPRFLMRCSFTGIPVKIYDHNRPQTPPPNFQAWIKFPTRPTYPDANSAEVDAGSLLGPLAGAGEHCTLKREGAEWRVQDCKMTWIS